MAEVVLSIGGRSYTIACRDGEEEHLHKLAAHVDGKAREASSAVGNTSEVRQLLFAALLLADEALEPVPAPLPTEPSAGSNRQNDARLHEIAAKLEDLATRLER